ncbi:MAG: hypothetical protein ACRDYW_10075, partial [Acidimicrobiales bacterium]
MEVPVPRSVRGWLVPVAVGVLLIVGALVLTDPGDDAPPATGGQRAAADPATGPNDAALGTDTSAPDA